MTQAQLAVKIEVTRQTISQYENDQIQPTKAKLYTLAKVLRVSVGQLYADNVDPNLTSESNSTGNEPVAKYGLPKSDEALHDKLIPLYDSIAVGGKELVAEDNGVSEPSEYVYPGSWFSDAVAAVKVYGDSMWPKYPNGCVVACREVKDRDLILWGQVYVIETSEFRVIKKVQKGESKELIRADSENSVKNNLGREIHESMEIPMKKIRRLFLVLGMANRLQA